MLVEHLDDELAREFDAESPESQIAVLAHAEGLLVPIDTRYRPRWSRTTPSG